jgi:hypothetical protein
MPAIMFGFEKPSEVHSGLRRQPVHRIALSGVLIHVHPSLRVWDERDGEQERRA